MKRSALDAVHQVLLLVLSLQADSAKQSVVDKVHQVQHKVQDEFDKMVPRNQEDRAWTEGRIASDTPTAQQQPSFHGSGRKIVTDGQQDAGSSGRIPSYTAAAQQGPSQGQGRRVEGQGWEETRPRVEERVAQVKDKAAGVSAQVQDSVKSASGNPPVPERVHQLLSDQT